MASTVSAAPTRAPLSSLFLVLLVAHVLDLVFRVGRTKGDVSFDGFGIMLFVFYAIISILAAFTWFRTNDPRANIRQLFVYLAISAVVWGVPYLANWLLGRLNGIAANVAFTLIVLVCSQLWLWFLWVAYADDIGKFWKGLFTVYVILLFLILIYSYPAFWTQLQKTELSGNGNFGLNDQMTALFEKARDTFVTLFTGVQTTSQQLSNASQQQMAFATGGYITSQVDKKATVPNEIKLENLQATQPSIRDTEQLTVYAALNTKTLETEAGNAFIDCHASTDGTGRKPIVSFPADTMLPSTGIVPLRPFDSVDISCGWDAGRFKGTGTRTALINMSATFDFTTDGYVKTYWIDREKITQMRLAKQDPYKQLSITDATLTTTFTPGPIKFGIGLGVGGSQETLKTIDRSSPSMEMLLALDLKALWPGALKSLNAVVLQVPKGVRITKVQYPANTDVLPVRCADLENQLNRADAGTTTAGTGVTTPAGSAAPTTETAADQPALTPAKRLAPPCDDKISSIYIIKPRVTNAKQITLLFVAEISEADYDAMTPVPGALRVFGATAYYTYRLEAINSVPVIATTDAGTPSTPGGTTLPTTLVGVPTITIVNANSVKVSYATSQPTRDTLRFYPRAGGGMTDVNEDNYATKPATTDHAITITSITPGVAYAYRITSRDQNNQDWVNQQPEWEFKTEAAP